MILFIKSMMTNAGKQLCTLDRNIYNVMFCFVVEYHAMYKQSVKESSPTPRSVFDLKRPVLRLILRVGLNLVKLLNSSLQL